MDQTVLRNSNVLILTGLTQTPTANPDTMLGELCMAVGKNFYLICCLYFIGTLKYLLSAHLSQFDLCSFWFLAGLLLIKEEENIFIKLCLIRFSLSSSINRWGIITFMCLTNSHCSFSKKCVYIRHTSNEANLLLIRFS